MGTSECNTLRAKGVEEEEEVIGESEHIRWAGFILTLFTIIWVKVKVKLSLYSTP
jgi:hypothetical protein